MHALTLLSTLLTTTSLITSTLASTPKLPTLTHAFTAHVYLGAPIGPITVATQITAVEPITSGTITGPHFNANVSAGAAAVSVLASKKLEIATPNVEIWGETDDGEPFFVQASGVGVTGKQFARVALTIGGKYAHLADEFILASFTDNDKNPPTESTIEAWFVTRS